MIEIFAATPWQMTLGERAALEGILAQLKPELAIEIGTAEGGSLSRVAHHSTTVHSFDLVEHSLPAELFSNVTFHTGDSHSLLPETLSKLADAGQNVDFALVDGDHSADGVEADMRDLLASPAVGKTVILIHDTLNEVVREGVLRVSLADHPKVAHVDLDMVGGHLSRDGEYRHQLWGGLGVVVVDDSTVGPDPGFHDPFEVFSAVRDALVADAAAGGPGMEIPGLVAAPEPGGDDDAQAREAALEREVTAQQQHLRALTGSASWRLTAPLRTAKQKLRGRG